MKTRSHTVDVWREKKGHLAYLVRRCVQRFVLLSVRKTRALDCTHSAQLWRALFEYTLVPRLGYPLLLVSAKVVKWQIQPLRHPTYSSCCEPAAEIKQAYRRVKLFHPDGNQETANHEQIIRINAAYEVLGRLVGSRTTRNCRFVRLLPA